MSFPVTPINGQTTVTNGISYIYNATSNAWFRQTTVLNLSTASTTSGTAASGTGTTSTFVISNVTQSTSTTTGALQVAGGAGIGGNLYVGGKIVANELDIVYTTITQTLVTSPDIFTITNITQSISTTSGALTVAGGIGVGGNVNIGGTVTGGGIRSTTSITPPSNPTVGDIWYQQGTDVVLRYENDGTTTTSYWVDITGPTVIISSGTVSGSLGGGGTFTGGIVANATTFSSTVTIGAAVTGTFTSVSLMVNTTDAILMPSGTTAQRPANPINGMFRYNSTSSLIEAYMAGSWITIASANYSANYLIVGGGGGGGSRYGGGGGAGGFLSGTISLSPGTSYTITVGAGGAGNTNSGAVSSGTNGLSSIAFGFTALGGGGGGGAGGGGGSGGGGAYNSSGGSGTPGQGNNGGSGIPGAQFEGAGGGGAGSAGAPAPTNTGAGGSGLANPITGSVIGQLSTGTYYLAGGGGGAAYQGSGNSGPGGAGGVGGGGSGDGTAAGSGGIAYTGGGGGGGNTSFPGGYNGGSGVVILSYVSQNQRGSGGTITNSGSGANTIWIHTFTATNTFIS